MYSLLLLGCASFVLTLVFVPIVRRIALRFGLVDRPDANRKIHVVPIPRLGGVAIMAATLCSYALLLLFGLNGQEIVRHGIPMFIRLLPAVLVIFGVGLVDDIFDLSPWIKLAAQIVAASLAWGAGFRLEALGGHYFIPEISLLLTVLWILACTNAVNLIDGVDGLATGAGLFATTAILIVASLHGNVDLIFATIPLAGALLGFLRYNFSPASIFLGDCGSLSIGFLLGCYGIVWSEKPATLLGMTAPLLALSVPLLDASISIVRRFLRQQPIFSADRLHIHHKLLSRGLTPRRVVLLLYGFCAVAAAASLLMSELHPRYQGVVILLVCLIIGIGLQYLGYNEFGIAGRLALFGGFRRMVTSEIVLNSFEKDLNDADSLERCWELLCNTYQQFGFSQVELYLDGLIRHGDDSDNWRVRIDFPGYGYMSLLRKAGAGNHGTAALLFVDCIDRVFSQKLERLNQAPSRVQVFASAD